MLQDLVAGPAGPLVVFSLRATDVTMATIRMLMIMRGHRLIAPLIGFVEILLWVTAVGIVVRFLDSPLHVVGYAAGFATGNYLGLRIEEKLALGVATVRTVVAQGGAELAGRAPTHRLRRDRDARARQERTRGGPLLRPP